MKKIDENNVKLREKSRKTPFEIAEETAKKRAILAKILEDTRQVVASYELLADVAKSTGMSPETLQRYADDALIELAEAMETHFGVSA